MNECLIKTSSGRDYYGVHVLDFYWDSIKIDLGDSVVLIKSETTGNKFKHLAFTVEVVDIEKFEDRIKRSKYDNWVIKRNYSIHNFEKKRKAQRKVDKLRKELQEAETKLKLY